MTTIDLATLIVGDLNWTNDEHQDVEHDDGDGGEAEDDERACPEPGCHLVFDTAIQRDTHIRLRHPA